MTTEQHLKAIEALAKRQYDEFKRSIAYQNHCTAADWVELYNLPYRVVLDYLKNWDRSQVKINICFPDPGYPVSKLMKIKPNELDIDRCTTEQNDGSSITDLEVFNTPKPEVYERIKKHNASLLPIWNQTTKEGLKEWERVFAYLLQGYDIDGFSLFDMFGNTDADITTLEARKRFYRGVQARYTAAVGKGYLNESPLYKPEYDELYTTHEFIIDWGMSKGVEDI